MKASFMILIYNKIVRYNKRKIGLNLDIIILHNDACALPPVTFPVTSEIPPSQGHASTLGGDNLLSLHPARLRPFPLSPSATMPLIHTGCCIEVTA